MVEVLGTILLVILMISVLALRSRVAELEKRMDMFSRRLSTPSPTPAETVASAAPLEQHGTVPNVRTHVVLPTPVSAENIFIEWLKENWLLKLGAFLILLAFGWLVTYAFLNDWIGPAGRIAMGLVGGALILALGFWRMKAYVTQGAVFVVLGATAILLTTYAARSLYDFFTPLSALALMFATSALVAFASGIYGRKQLAVVSVALAGFAPMLTHSPTNDYIGLFMYLFVVIIGAVWIVAWKDFREVIATAFAVVVFYSLPVLFGFERADMSTLLLFAYAFAGVFYLTNTAGLLRLKGEAATSDLITATGNSMLLLFWIHRAASHEWQSLIIDAWAVAFVLGAFVIFRMTRNVAPMYLYAAIGVAYIAASTALTFHGSSLTIAYTIESAGVALVLYALTRNIDIASKSVYLLLGPSILAMPSIVESWPDAVFNEHFFVLAILSATYFMLSVAFWEAAERSTSEEVRQSRTFLIVAGSIFAYILVWRSLHVIFSATPDTAVMSALIIYTVIGITAYVQGMLRGKKGLRAYGGILLGFVVGRLLIVDVWQMELAGKIITFFLIGALLMSTAFMAKDRSKTLPVQPESH